MTKIKSIAVASVLNAGNYFTDTFSAFYEKFDANLGTNSDTGQDRLPDAAIRSFLNFLCQTTERQLTGEIKTSNGSIPNLKERMDSSQARIDRVKARYNDDMDGLVIDPEFLNAVSYFEEAEAKYDAFVTMLNDMKAAYKHHTGEEWATRVVGEATNTRAVRKPSAEALARFAGGAKHAAAA